MNLVLNTASAVSLLVSVVLPLLSSLLTKAHWPSEVRGVLTLALSIVTGFLTEWAHAGSDFRWQPAASAAVVSFVIAVLSRYGLWRGTVTDMKLLAVGSGPKA